MSPSMQPFQENQAKIVLFSTRKFRHLVIECMMTFKQLTALHELLDAYSGSRDARW